MKEKSVKELLSDFDKCEKLVIANRGKIITKKLAKEIYQLSKGGFRISEEKVGEDLTYVQIQRVINKLFVEQEFEWNFFLVKGMLYDKLNMCD